jgi:hypothetical protein
MVMTEPTAPFEPYIGPQPFHLVDANRFYARKVEARELFASTVAHQLVVLYAVSGAGKTSLLQAGLQPLLKKRGFEVLPIARVRDPSTSDRNAAAENVYAAGVVSSLGRSDAAGLEQGKNLVSDWLSSTAREQHVPRALIIDQFEELFTHRPDRWQDRSAFVADIARALDDDPLLRVVLALREDYLAEFDTYANLLPSGLQDRYRLPRLDEDGALAAIQGPLESSGWRFDDDAAQRLVHDLRTEQVEISPGRTQPVLGEFVEPVQLQVVCQQIWHAVTAAPRAPSERVITQSDVRRFGDVTKALSDFYERALRKAVAESGEEEWRLRSWFETYLITPAGTRGFVYQGARDTQGIRNKAVDVLVSEHLLRGEVRAGAHWYELTHDRLITPIRDANASRRQPGRYSWVSTVGWISILVAAIVVGGLIWLALRTSAAPAVLKASAVLALAVLPGWLYVSFVRNRVRLMWDEYVLTLFRLRADALAALPEPPQTSQYHARWLQAGGLPDDVNNIYLRKFEASFGYGLLPAVRGYGRVRVSPALLSLVIPTVVLSGLGWWAVLRPDLMSPHSSSLITVLRIGQLPEANYILHRMLWLACAQSAFVGAYLYATYRLLQLSLQGALRANSYAVTALRLVVATLLGATIGLFWPYSFSSQVAVVFTFLVAVIPTGGVAALQAAVAGALRVAVPSLSSAYPLSDLDGLTLAAERRLSLEGIDDMTSLVTCNLVDVLLHTRLPAPQLVNWVDQACLYIYLPRIRDGFYDRAHAKSQSSDSNWPNRNALRRIGVRMATDLERMLATGEQLLDDERLRPLLPLARNLRREANLVYVRAWRSERLDQQVQPSQEHSPAPSA